MAIVFAARVVENCEQPDDFFDSSASCGYEQTVPFDTTPVRRAVHRIAVALKFSRHVLPDAAPL